MKNLRTILFGFCIFGYGIATQAQEAATTAGGDASGSGGKVNYTIGQIVYTTNTGGNGTITQGVQQPYEVFVLQAVNELGYGKDILGINLFPNPTDNIIKLKIDAAAIHGLQSISYMLYDMNGKLIENNKVNGTETSISMGALSPAIYFLKVTENSKELKVFKIVKN